MSDRIAKCNKDLEGKTPLEVVEWAVKKGKGRSIVSTNFRPHEAVILHLVTRVQPNIPVLWVDTGYNTPATYRFAEKVIDLLSLDVKRYIPLRSAAHRDAINHGIPSIDDEEKHNQFTQEVKIEPFNRGLADLDPKVWFTALRKGQTAFRDTLDYVSEHTNGVLKISPVFHFSDDEMEAYLMTHGLPDEKDYYDPTKVLEKRECGLHLDLAKGTGI